MNRVDPRSEDAQVRWGIVGPGRIAEKVVEDFAHVENARAVAVASRSAARAADFARRHDIERSYGSYAEIIADPDVDVLYLATPHSTHHAIALAALRVGKALLIEKSFTATVSGAAEVIDLARSTGTFVMEAMWTRFQPATVAAKAVIDDGVIGEVRQVQADLGVDRPFNPSDRLFNLAQGGGALLDVGVYGVSFAQFFLGTPDVVTATGALASTGVDLEVGVLLGYDDGQAATVLASLRNPTPGQARIFGTHGWIDVLPRFHHPRAVVLHRNGSEPETITRPPSGGGYAHELTEVTECLRRGATESATMPLADSLAVQRALNRACEQLGVFHAEDAGVDL